MNSNQFLLIKKNCCYKEFIVSRLINVQVFLSYYRVLEGKGYIQKSCLLYWMPWSEVDTQCLCSPVPSTVWLEMT